MHWTNLEKDLPKVGVRPLEHLSIPILGRHITSTARLPTAPSAPQRCGDQQRVERLLWLRARTSLSRPVIGRAAHHAHDDSSRWQQQPQALCSPLDRHALMAGLIVQAMPAALQPAQ